VPSVQSDLVAPALALAVELALEWVAVLLALAVELALEWVAVLLAPQEPGQVLRALRVPVLVAAVVVA
jgi:hypothetical protein